MNDIMIVQKMFEEIKMLDWDFEFWSARELIKVLWYVDWRKFLWVIEKAKIACKNSWQDINDHFVGGDKLVNIWSWTQRAIDDYLLTRYACYLIAQNWDSRKQEISFAQTYFASQTRKQEINDKKIEENKRLEARHKLKITEEKIEDTVYHRWIKLPYEFATFKNKKIEALYNMSVKELKNKRGIKENRALADFDSEVELKAKEFIYAMTDHNIKTNKINWKQNLENELIDNAKATRTTLIKRWITPEELPTQEDLKIIEKRRENENLKKIKSQDKKKLK